MAIWGGPFKVGEIQREGVGIEWYLLAKKGVSREDIINFVGGVLKDDPEEIVKVSIREIFTLGNGFLQVRGRIDDRVVADPGNLLDNATAPSWLEMFQMSWANSYKWPDAGGTFAIETVRDAVVASYFAREEWKDGGETYDWDIVLVQSPQEAIYLPETVVGSAHFYGVMKYGIGRILGGVIIKPDGIYAEVKF